MFYDFQCEYITFAAPISPPQNLLNSQFHWVPAIRELRGHISGAQIVSRAQYKDTGAYPLQAG